MKHYPTRIQIGDVQAFKQMIEDTIKNRKLNMECEEIKYNKNSQSSFSHNDKHYRIKAKIKIDALDN